LKTVSVILLSARAGREARVDGIEQGADDYLVKPFSSTGIGLAIVGKAMERMRGEVGVQSDGVHGSTFWIAPGRQPSGLKINDG
jgi:DNA-binding response OmpR family regulator